MGQRWAWMADRESNEDRPTGKSRKQVFTSRQVDRQDRAISQ